MDKHELAATILDLPFACSAFNDPLPPVPNADGTVEPGDLFAAPMAGGGRMWWMVLACLGSGTVLVPITEHPLDPQGDVICEESALADVLHLHASLRFEMKRPRLVMAEERLPPSFVLACSRIPEAHPDGSHPLQQRRPTEDDVMVGQRLRLHGRFEFPGMYEASSNEPLSKIAGEVMEGGELIEMRLDATALFKGVTVHFWAGDERLVLLGGVPEMREGPDVVQLDPTSVLVDSRDRIVRVPLSRFAPLPAIEVENGSVHLLLSDEAE